MSKMLGKSQCSSGIFDTEHGNIFFTARHFDVVSIQTPFWVTTGRFLDANTYILNLLLLILSL